ncbi:MAG: hypothetical protein RLZZ241_365 [Bacteroidota bacterium]|jgi:type IX secretion system PorP/SprF family membrane protein
MKVTNYILIVFGCFALQLHAQQDAQYTQYMYNTMSVNPAYAGSRGQLSMTSLYRSQWTGIEGSPQTFTLNLHSPIRNSSLGYGVSIVNDNIGNGVVQETYMDAVLSYTLNLNQDAKLSFGLKAGGNFLSLDFNGLKKYQQELVDSDNIDRRFTPNFGLGVYYHHNRFYTGISAPNLMESKHFNNSAGSANDFLSVDRVNFYWIAGYVMDLSGTMKFKPAILTKMVSGAPFQLDLSGTFLFQDTFSFGAAYRLNAAISGLIGFQVSEQVMLGLAYDKETTDLGGMRFNDGSLEFLLRWELLKSYKRVISPRFF